jgi:hypothetical protein
MARHATGAGARIVARVLATAFRDGLRAVRASGWRGPALALLSYVPVAATYAFGAALLVGLVLHVVVLLALVRLLGAVRPLPVPPPPAVDGDGHRVAPPPKPGPPLTAADRSPKVALRNASRLWRPAVSVTGLYLLAQFTALLTVVAVSGGRVVDYSPDAQLVAVLPVSAVFLAFVFVATQRVGLEGDPRVLVAAAHSVRVARTAYGPLLLLALAEPAVAAAGSLAVPDKHAPLARVLLVGAVTILVAAAVKVVVTAVANEVYLTGPRLDLPVADPVG